MKQAPLPAHRTASCVAPTSRRRARPYLLLALLLGFLASCQRTGNEAVTPKPGTTLDATVALTWMDTFLALDRYAPGYRPPVAARALAYVSLAAYETAVPVSDTYQSVAINFAGLILPTFDRKQAFQPDAAVNAAFYTITKAMFPHVSTEYKQRIEDTYRDVERQYATADAATVTRSKQFGTDVANAVFAFSKTDLAGHEAYLHNQPTDYVAPTGIGKWQPTAPDFGRALLPYWGKVRTFVANESDKLAKPPLAYSTNATSTLFAQALEVYSATTPLTKEQQWIGEFWSDDIYKLTFEPAGRWLAVAQQVIRKENVPLDKALYTYVKVGIGLSDIGVACWNSKYVYNVERPITYIRRSIDPTWRTRLNNPIAIMEGVTPPFPAYPSGHSCFGAVAAEILTDIYGANYALIDRCHEGRTEFKGAPRTFNNFYEMAQENAYSRVVLGVHYRMDCEEGMRMGYAIGRKVNALKWKK